VAGRVKSLALDMTRELGMNTRATGQAHRDPPADESQPTPVAFESAGEHICHRVPVATPAMSAGELREQLTAERYESVIDVAVCEGERLVGMVRIEDVLAAPPGARVDELMDRDPPVVGPHTDQELAAGRAVAHGERSLAVVDDARRFVGIVPPERILDVLLAEHHEDLARLGGFLEGTREARLGAEERVPRRVGHRLPWLLVGLAGAVLSAVIVGAFETKLREEVLLAFFLPGVVYLADAVGTQTETLIIRGFSVGVGIRRVLRLELLTGLIVGVILAAAFLPVGVLGWGRGDVAVAVALALLGACSTATVVAMTLPWLLQRLGRDPAFGSGPLATVVQDLLSVLIYFAIGSAIID
jgi:magnesium transporter